MKDMENGTVHEKRDGTMRRLFVSLKGKKIAAAGIAVLLLASAVMPAATFAGDGRGEKARMVKITEDEAIAIVRKQANLGPDTQILSEGLDWEDGRLVYEVEYKDANGRKMDVLVDAQSGAIVESELDDE